MKSVFIDAGHGGNDPGALGCGKKEADITLSVSLKVKKLLENMGIKVHMSREDNSTLSLSQRTNKANKTGANCLVSIHCNAFNGSAKGVETFAYKSSLNNLATDIHNEVLKSKVYTVNRGIKTANFHMIRESKMRAALIELAFIDNQEDNNILMNRQDDLAKAITKGICKHLGVTFKEEVVTLKPPTTSDTSGVYQVICGSYGDKQNAINMQNELKEKGFDSFLEFEKK